ncbi:DNA primase family protein [Paraburkholderia phenazinium]|uniref:DNA primase family protein n=1 Tax=Paraburkholderia phenazinium TaxID=60549 RepID=UPI00115FFA6E|nr:DUF5906 domain-containing protein [Paraburkholderia phenazinium]
MKPTGTRKATKGKDSAELFYAERLAKDLDLAVGSGETPELFRWNSVYWEAQRDVVLEQDALAQLAQIDPSKYSVRKARSMVETAVTRLSGQKALPVHAAKAGVLVPLKDGVLEVLRSGIVKAHKPQKSFGVTHAINATIDWTRVGNDGVYSLLPLKSDSRFGRFLEQVQPNPAMRDYLAECFGSTLSTMNVQKAIILEGSGANGKSLCLQVLSAFHANPVAFDLSKLDGEFNTEPLVHATLITVSEAPPRKRPINENLFKAWVARDPVSVNRKNRVPLTIKPRASWVLAMNEAMGFSDMSHGFLRRIANVPFSQTIRAEDQIPDLDRLITESAEEMAIALDWLLSGLIALTKRGRFMSDDEQPEEVRTHKVSLRKSNDTALDWAEIVDADQANEWADKVVVYNAYRDFCAESGRHAVEANEFWKRLRRDLLASKGFDLGAPENNRRAPKDRDGNRARLVRMRADGVPTVLVTGGPASTPVKPMQHAPSAVPALTVVEDLSEVFGKPSDHGHGATPA